MSTPTPPGDVSVTAPACPACGAPLPSGRFRALLLSGLPTGGLPSAPPNSCGRSPDRREAGEPGGPEEDVTTGQLRHADLAFQ